LVGIYRHLDDPETGRFWKFSKPVKISISQNRNSKSVDIIDKILVIKANLDNVLLAPSTEIDEDDEQEEEIIND
jgi:hypothetical protein